jgi:hypothetical protein
MAFVSAPESAAGRREGNGLLDSFIGFVLGVDLQVDHELVRELF